MMKDSDPVTNIDYSEAKTKVTAYPNPFKSQIDITLPVLSQDSQVTIEIYAGSGKKITTLVSNKKNFSEQTITWHPENIEQGIYYCRFTSKSWNEVTRLIYEH